MKYVPLREAKRTLGLCGKTLRKYADEEKIETIRSPGGKRLFNLESFIGLPTKNYIFCYCRVSSAKQKDDLARQVTFMREKFPSAQIIQDIGSGLNFKRKGLRSILERAMCGDKLTLVVAHRDRLARFGFELIEFVIQKTGGEILVLDRTEHSPERELTEDLLAILTVFSCRMHGLRRYCTKIQKDKNLSN
jgi:putative resolvase